MFSRACEYAIKSMIYIASNEKEGKRTGLKEVTNALGSPEAFTAKILQRLVKAGLLASYRGPSGGFELPGGDEIKILDVVLAIDGEHLVKDCVLGLAECSDTNPCPVHDRYADVRNLLQETLLSACIKDEVLLSRSKNLKPHNI